MSWVSKFRNLFLTWSETETRFIFEGFKYFPFMESSFPTLRYFFSFFHLVYKLFKEIFQPLCQSVNCISWVFESCNNSEMPRSLSINLYLRPCDFAIYWKFYLNCLYHFRLFFSSVNCTNSVYKLCITFWKCYDTQILFILECI